MQNESHAAWKREQQQDSYIKFVWNYQRQTKTVVISPLNTHGPNWNLGNVSFEETKKKIRLKKEYYFVKKPTGIYTNEK